MASYGHIGDRGRAGAATTATPGNANGVDGDTILLGPPFVITDAELGQVVARLGDAVEAVAAAESVA